MTQPTVVAELNGVSVTTISANDWQALRAEADRAATFARSPYSGIRVGAAGLVIIDGVEEILSGCNVESASFGCTLCAECGLVSAVSRAGADRLVAVAVTDGSGNLLMPCGRCRQLLHDVAGSDLLVDHPNGPQRIAALLPNAFTEADVKRDD